MNLLALFARWVSEGNDPTLTVTGIRQVYSGFEQWKGIQSARKARLHSKSGRPYAKASQTDALRRVR